MRDAVEKTLIILANSLSINTTLFYPSRYKLDRTIYNKLTNSSMVKLASFKIFFRVLIFRISVP